MFAYEQGIRFATKPDTLTMVLHRTANWIE
jgi:hypothetical protein